MLSRPSGEWEGRKGCVKVDVIEKVGFALGEGSVVFLCRLLAVMQKAALPVLREWWMGRGRFVLACEIIWRAVSSVLFLEDSFLERDVHVG